MRIGTFPAPFDAAKLSDIAEDAECCWLVYDNSLYRYRKDTHCLAAVHQPPGALRDLQPGMNGCFFLEEAQGQWRLGWAANAADGGTLFAPESWTAPLKYHVIESPGAAGVLVKDGLSVLHFYHVEAASGGLKTARVEKLCLPGQTRPPRASAT